MYSAIRPQFGAATSRERSGHQCGTQRWEDGAVLGKFGRERGGGTAASGQGADVKVEDKY
jgi:hypothetical protein